MRFKTITELEEYVDRLIKLLEEIDSFKEKQLILNAIRLDENLSQMARKISILAEFSRYTKVAR